MKSVTKKIFIILFTFTLYLSGISTLSVKGAEKSLEFNSKANYLIDANSQTVISSKNENERLQIASMTKIMLLLLIYENEYNDNLSFDEEVIVSKNASSMGGSQVFLEEGGVYKVSELVKSITVASANDASVAMAERLYGSEENCVAQMNKKAAELGLKNTLFCNVTGLPKPMQYSSSKDIATIFLNLINYDKYFNFSSIWMDSIKHKENSTEISNTNKLIRFYEGCDGGKTGFTNEAGFCLTATAKRGNMRLISVVIGSESSKERFKEVSTLFDYGFNNYTNKVVVDKTFPIEERLLLNNSTKESIEVIPSNDFYIFTKKNTNVNIDTIINFKSLSAPIKTSDVVGEIVIYKDGVEIGKVNLLANENADKMGYFDYLKNIIKDYTI